MSEDKNNKKNHEFIFGLIKNRIEKEFDSSHKKDEKAGILFGFNSILLSIILASMDKLINRTQLISCLGLIGLLFIIASIITSFLSIKVRAYRFDPDPENLWKNYKDKSYEETLKQVIANLIEAYKENKEALDSKAKYTNLSYIFTIIGLALIVIRLLFGGI